MSKPANLQFELFFDGECPLCRREVAFLARRDRHGDVRFTDIAAPGFRAERYGRDRATFMARIHGRLPDGSFVEGVEVFRRVYEAVGFRRLAAFSRWPLISGALDWLYTVFARNRLRLTGRCQDDVCAVRSRSGGDEPGGAER